MSITNYGTLKSGIADWAKRDDLTSEIPGFIELGEDMIAQTLRVRDMETTEDLTISSQTTALSGLTKTFLEQRRLYLDTELRKRLEYYPPEDFWIRVGANETGTPKIYTIEGNSLVVAPSPDISYTGKLLYFGRYAALSADEDTNWIFSNARMLYLASSMVELSQFIEDETGILKWAVRYEDILDKVHKMDKRGKYPAGSLVARSDVLSRGELHVSRS